MDGQTQCLLPFLYGRGHNNTIYSVKVQLVCMSDVGVADGNYVAMVTGELGLCCTR